jgi:hypothetical protein
VGKLTGAKVLVTGRVFKTDTELFHRRQNHRHGNQPRLWRNGQGQRGRLHFRFVGSLAKEDRGGRDDRKATRWSPKWNRTKTVLQKSKRNWPTKSCRSVSVKIQRAAFRAARH